MRASRFVLSLSLLLPAVAAAQEGSNPEPSTAAKRTIRNAEAKASIYDPKLDALDQVKTAGAIARRDNQRLLVMFGGDWCGWCHKLHGLFKSDRQIAKILLEDYKLVMVDTKAPHADELLKECQGDLKSVGYPFLAVLDADGKVITRQPTDPLEEGDHHDPAKVREFLTKWAPEKQAASKVMEEALARASSEDRRVLLHFGAPWCGWCHKLDDFLAREDMKSVIGKDFIDVKIDVDRMVGGKDVEAKYRKNVQGGIPWIAILDPKGEALCDSDGPKGNIGYPAAPEEIAHFIAMLKKTARKLDAADIEKVEKALKAAPEARGRAAAE